MLPIFNSIRVHPSLVLLTGLLLVMAAACGGAAPSPTAAGSPTPAALPAQATATATSTKLPTATSTAEPTETPRPSPAPFAASDPRLAELVAQGYSQEPLLRFEPLQPMTQATFFDNQGQFGGDLRIGGPTFDDPDPPDRLSVRAPDGRTYTYLQYCRDREDCRLLFYVSAGSGDARLIADVDPSGLSTRVGRITRGGDTITGVASMALPYAWGDLNRNGRPDIAVTLLWGNNFTGGEVHIFEVKEDDTVACLTKDLPGPLSHWNFDPDSDLEMVVDAAWAEHDCIYPRCPFSFWVYGWDSETGALEDLTASGRVEVTGTSYAAFLESLLEPDGPFEPERHIGPLVTLLLLYDKSGQREAGWTKFLELADESRYPGTDEAALAWLRADVAHFTKEYEAGAAFTPGDYGCER